MLSKELEKRPTHPEFGTDYIQKTRGEPRLFSFEYNLLPKLISNFYALNGPGIYVHLCQPAKKLPKSHILFYKNISLLIYVIVCL